ncbi:MAG: MarR family transcriptional regulator [Rhodospirillales bacterium]|nr:MarR family transcriptional regulator [Rhodospirillales bacterium]
MARTGRNAKIDSRSARVKLSARREPYWALISKGCAVGYRKGAAGGTWIARYRDAAGKQRYNALGAADDAMDSDGGGLCLNYAEVRRKADEWFKSAARGFAEEGAPTVTDAPAGESSIVGGGNQRRDVMGRRKFPIERPQTLELSRYTFALIISMANKLNSGASSHLIKKFGIGVEAWRVLGLIAAIGREINAQQICQFSGMDKGAVSRTLRSMKSKGLIVVRTDEDDGRLKFVSFLPEGKRMHDLIVDFHLEREKSFLSVLTAAEVDVFIDLLTRTRANLPNVEVASTAYAQERWHSLESRR